MIRQYSIGALLVCVVLATLCRDIHGTEAASHRAESVHRALDEDEDLSHRTEPAHHRIDEVPHRTEPARRTIDEYVLHRAEAAHRALDEDKHVSHSTEPVYHDLVQHSHSTESAHRALDEDKHVSHRTEPAYHDLVQHSHSTESAHRALDEAAQLARHGGSARDIAQCHSIPAAQRRIALLALHADARSGTHLRCDGDQACPCGSYCDRAVCRVDCIDDDPPPALTCGAGLSCTLGGRCAAAEAGYVMPSHTLDVADIRCAAESVQHTPAPHRG